LKGLAAEPAQALETLGEIAQDELPDGDRQDSTYQMACHFKIEPCPTALPAQWRSSSLTLRMAT
jgi:hypothetical protein